MLAHQASRLGSGQVPTCPAGAPRAHQQRLCRRAQPQLCHVSSGAGALPDQPQQPPASQQQQQQQQLSLFGRIQAWFGQSKLDKQKLAEYGLGAFAAYGIISNLNAGICVTLAWMTIVGQTGLTPLAAGQWPTFLAVYAGLWVGAGFLRPLRLSLALAAAPFFNRFLERVQAAFRVSKGFAFGILLCLIAAGSCCFMFTCLLLAGGFPGGLPFIPSLRG